VFYIKIIFLIKSWLKESVSTYQLGFQDPATTQMEDIFFNLYLLFVIFSILTFVGCLLFLIILNFTELSDSNALTIAKTSVDCLQSTLNSKYALKNFSFTAIRQTHVMSKAFSGSFRTRIYLMAQNKPKICIGPKLIGIFSSNRTMTTLKDHRTIKTILFDMFLKYQYTVCVEPKTPLNHLIPLFLLTCLFHSFYYIIIYWISIFYIIFTLYLAEKFPDSFGSRYLNLLKRHSSTEAFERYCGNSWGALKTAIKNPEFISVVAKNGAGKAITGTGVALGAEHVIHKAKIGQIVEFKADEYINGGQHSSKEPFSFKPNGQSMIEYIIGKN
jgi:hypothetical protein